MKKTLSIAAIVALFVLAVPASFGQAADLYKTRCAGCHGADGKGATPAGKAMGARDLTAGPAAKETDAEWITITTKGKNKMPGYDGKLTTAQISDLVKFIRTLK
jgi:mono/diheme cytochrome c family protein